MCCRVKRDDMKPDTLTALLKTAVTKGVQRALDENGLISGKLTAAAAYRLYGRSNVDRWLQEELIRTLPLSGHSPKRLLDAGQLEAIAHASNRCTYLSVAER